MGFFRGKMDFSRASYNEKNNRQHQSFQQTSSFPDRSMSSSGYIHQPTNIETTSTNVLPGFTKPSVLRTVNSMYKSNTSLDLDLEVSLVERAVNNVQIMTDGGIRSSNHQTTSAHQVPSTTTTANSGQRRLPNIGHNHTKMRDFSGSHGSIVDVLSNKQLGSDDMSANEEGQRNHTVHTRFVIFIIMLITFVKCVEYVIPFIESYFIFI